MKGGREGRKGKKQERKNGNEKEKNIISEYDINTHLVKRWNQTYLENVSSNKLSWEIYF